MYYRKKSRLQRYEKALAVSGRILYQEIKDILLQQIKEMSPKSEEVKKDYDMINSTNPPVPIRPVPD
jgi:hypothetical protein